MQKIQSEFTNIFAEFFVNSLHRLKKALKQKSKVTRIIEEMNGITPAMKLLDAV
jgi:hypothetical protein